MTKGEAVAGAGLGLFWVIMWPIGFVILSARRVGWAAGSAIVKQLTAKSRGAAPRLVALLAAGGLGLAGCGYSPTQPRVCTAIAVDALVVTVVDAATMQRICDATVVAVDGSFSAELRPFPAGQDCTYSGPTERAGTYEVRVSKAGYGPASQAGIRVTADECHVIPVRVTIQLRRTGS